MILVSHDRALLEAVGSRTAVFENAALRSYPTGWAAYQPQRDEEQEAPARPAAKQSSKAEKGGSRVSAKTAVRKASRLAEKIEAAEAELHSVEQELADPAAWSTPDKAAEASKVKLPELYEQWEAAEKWPKPGSPSTMPLS